MKWTFRWYGQDDPISLKYINQIPNMYGVVGTLVDKLPGEKWELEEIQNLKKQVEKEGLKLAGIESVSVHDAIKAGTSDRDYYINNYKKTIENLGKSGISVICYSFKPIFGWAKTNLNYKLPDGSETLEYNHKVTEQISPDQMMSLVTGQTKGFKLSGWEPERLNKFKELQNMYDGITEEKLFNNLVYFLERVIPICEEFDVKLAIHADDPPWEMLGYPRITKNINDLKKIMSAVNSPNNGITLCTGSYGANPDNDIISMINTFKDRIHFVHLRNIKIIGEKHFYESAHPSTYGELDMYEIMSTLVKNNFNGIIRPDHGRTIWGENARPGYGLYDRGLGLTYMQGLEEAILKSNTKEG